MPAVSVILPVLIAETTVARAVDSILQQTSVDLELIVVDDGLTDRTVPTLQNQRDGRLKILSTDHGAVAAATGNRSTPCVRSSSPKNRQQYA
ncbi:MAG: glycosyltransferase [Fuerstiella sp.]